LHSGSSESEQRENRRRSARLSADKESFSQGPVTKSKRITRKPEEHKVSSSDSLKAIEPSKLHIPASKLQGQAVDRDGSPDVAPNELHVEKPRDGTKIALPFADTPIIRRNKEMRQQTKSKHRRSSTGLRGRRASSLIESGTSNGRIIYTYSTKYVSKSASKITRISSLFSESSTPSQCDVEEDQQIEEQFTNHFLDNVAVPHADVAIPDFYKHIEQSLPEPRRMKQLLTWCGTRALPEKAHGGTGDANEMLAKDSARHISEELLKDFANKAELSDWFSREDGPEQDDASVIKKPNPRNVRNAEKLKELEEEIQRLQEEKQSWEGLLSSKLSPRNQTSDLTTINSELLDPAQAAILATLHAPSIPAPQTITSEMPTASSHSKPTLTPLEPQSSLSLRINTIVDSLEPQIDLFADGIHKISQYRLAAERVADRLLSSTADKLESRDRAAREASGTAGVSAKDVLSALGGALSERSR
jgi:kinetochore protein Mis13/DSN1